VMSCDSADVKSNLNFKIEPGIDLMPGHIL